MRDDLFPQHPEKGGVTEHLTDLDGERRQDLSEDLRIAQHLLLQARERLETEFLHSLSEPSLERGRRVLAEVVVVPEVNALEEERDLDILDAAFHRVPT